MPEMTSASFGPQVTIPISKHMPKYFPPPCKSFLVVPKLVSGVACICKCKIVQICSVVEMPAPVSHCACLPGSPSLLAGQVSTTCKHSSPLLLTVAAVLTTLLTAPRPATGNYSNFCTNSELVSLYHSVTEHEDAFSIMLCSNHSFLLFVQ